MTTYNPSSDASWHASFVGRLSLLFGVLVVILATLGIRVWQTSDRFIVEDDWVTHTLEVKNYTQSILARLGAIQAAAAAYATSGNEARLQEFTAEAPLLDNDIEALEKLVADNPAQVERVRTLAAVAKARRDLLAEAVAARRQSGRQPSLPDTSIDDVRQAARQVIAIEDHLLETRRQDARHTAKVTRALTTLAVLISIAGLALAFWLATRSYSGQRLQRQNLRDSYAQLQSSMTETQRLSESMQQLAQFGELLQTCHSIDEVRDGVPAAIAGFLPGIGARMALLNPSQNLLAVGAHWGEHGLIAESVFAPEDCWALRRGQAYPLAGASGGFVCKHVHWPNPDQADASYLCVPMAAQGEIIGVLTFDASRALDAIERRFAIATAEHLGLALANLRLQDTLRTQSIRDPLTGLFNRRYLEVSLERELMRATRRSHPLSVLMLDLDHFKRFNDTYGHDAGDTLLAQFALALKQCMRSEDIACRYGGEEFTVILLEADAAIARKRAEQIRSVTSQLAVEHRKQPLGRVSVSIGISVFPQDGQTPEDLLRRADAALYQAKNAGRDCVVVAGESDAA